MSHCIAWGVYGISWTPIFEKAKQFANRRSPDEGPGIVLRVEATATMIIEPLKIIHNIDWRWVRMNMSLIQA